MWVIHKHLSNLFRLFCCPNLFYFQRMVLLQHVALHSCTRNFCQSHYLYLPLKPILRKTQTSGSVLSLPDFPGKPIFEIKRVVLHLGILPNVQTCHVSVTIKCSLANQCNTMPSAWILASYCQNKAQISIMTRASYSECLHVLFYAFMSWLWSCIYRQHSRLQFLSFNYVRSEVHESHGAFD